MTPGIDAEYDFAIPEGGWSQATHCCWVEVDPHTGRVHIDRYLVVEDCGALINPTIVEGQIAGGVAQGIGGVLFERAAYDDERPAAHVDVRRLPAPDRRRDPRHRDPPPRVAAARPRRLPRRRRRWRHRRTRRAVQRDRRRPPALGRSRPRPAPPPDEDPRAPRPLALTEPASRGGHLADFDAVRGGGQITPRSRAQARFLRAEPTCAMWTTCASPWLGSPWRIGTAADALGLRRQLVELAPVRDLVGRGREHLVHQRHVFGAAEHHPVVPEVRAATSRTRGGRRGRRARRPTCR